MLLAEIMLAVAAGIVADMLRPDTERGTIVAATAGSVGHCAVLVALQIMIPGPVIQHDWGFRAMVSAVLWTPAGALLSLLQLRHASSRNFATVCFAINLAAVGWSGIMVVTD